MIPIRDHNPSGKFPFFTYLFIIGNSLIFFYSFFLPPASWESFINQYALIPALVSQGENLYSLFTSIFLHGNLLHLLGNMLFLNIFGDNLEDKLGHFKYLLFYFSCGLGASGLQILVNPHSPIPMLGASGAIAGALGGYLIFFPRHKVDVLFSFGLSLRKQTIPAATMLIYWIFFQIIFGLQGLGGVQGDGIAYFAHIGGFVTGTIWSLFSSKKSKLFLLS